MPPEKPTRRRVNPAMLRLARESRGMTQKELARAIGATQGTICKYELETPVPEGDLEAIAQVLDYVPSFFYRDDQMYGRGTTLIFHRARVRVAAKVQTRVQADINIRKMQITSLLRATSIQSDHVFPLLPIEEYSHNPEVIARAVRELWQLPDGPIPDLTSVVESAGGIVIHVDFGTKLIDGIHLWIGGLCPVFFMNKNVPGERYRYSLAHEVGHAVMHQTSVMGDVEDEANKFASELLMPRSLVRADLQGFNLEVAARLKRVWKVSMQALTMRAWQLRIIGNRARQGLFAHLGSRGFRIDEPWPLPLEEPKVFDRLVAFHRNELNLSDEDMRHVLFTEYLGPDWEPDSAQQGTLRIVQEEGLFDS